MPCIKGGDLEAAENAQKKILIVDDACINVLALSMYEIITFSLLALALCPSLHAFDHWSQIQSNTDERSEHLSQSTDIYIIQPGPFFSPEN